jgi:dolichol-phosphate mannosyltransferase
MSVPVDLSFVIPVYNEEAVFDRLAERMRRTMDASGLVCEVVFVDDGSRDGTREKIERLAAADPRFRGVLLSRNFGHQRAVSAGLDYVRGRQVGILDGDLQDPPETLLQFREKLAEGYDVVYAVRQRRKESAPKRFCYWAFYRLLRRMATIDIPLDSGDFCLMTDRVVQQIRSMPERQRFIRGMRSWAGFRQIGVPYDRNARAAGESKYTMSKLVLLALDGIFTFSELPVRLATLIGVAVAAVALLWALRTLVWRLLGDATSVPGFATLACGMFFLAGVQLICMGILGEYIARIHNEVKGRPVYVVDRL